MDPAPGRYIAMVYDFGGGALSDWQGGVTFGSPQKPVRGIRETTTANTGDIVVALVDGQEATLKRFRRQNGKVALEAANPAYETRVYSDDRVKVQGRLVGLIRTY